MTPIVAGIVLLLLLTVAGAAYYYLVGRSSTTVEPEGALEVAQETDPQTAQLEQTSNSDELDAIELDIEGTIETDLETDVNTLEQSL